MIIIKAPFRISFFGGSTDYKSFYKEHGSFIIGTTIDKYVWLSARFRPKILPKHHSISYSKLETVTSVDDIQNPLIREVLKHYKIKDHIDFHSAADIPARTGLGGSSSFCAGMVHLIKHLKGEKINKENIAKTAIKIERDILKESGGIQDQIWAAYGGLNTIEIDKKGAFTVKPIPVSEKFKKELEKSIVLIYTNNQRNQDEIAKSHENKDKKKILDISRKAYTYFLNEDIQKIGKLLYQSWIEKRNISPLVSTPQIDSIIKTVMDMGAYGAKLLGSGGCGFVMVICNQKTKTKVVKKFKKDILPIQFEYGGSSLIHKN